MASLQACYTGYLWARPTLKELHFHVSLFTPKYMFLVLTYYIFQFDVRPVVLKKNIKKYQTIWKLDQKSIYKCACWKTDPSLQTDFTHLLKATYNNNENNNNILILPSEPRW